MMSSIRIILQSFVYKELMSMLKFDAICSNLKYCKYKPRKWKCFHSILSLVTFWQIWFESHSQRPSWTPTKSIIQVLQSDMMCIFLADFQDVIDSCTESNFYVCLDLQTICSFELMQFTVFVYHKRCKFTSINLKNLYITTCQSIAI